MIAAEDTAQKWPEYKENMAHMGLAYKSAQEFLDLSSDDRKAALADSQGTGRAWHQVIRGYYSATDGWKTYKKCHDKMEAPADYSEYDFTHLPLSEIDTLARGAKRACGLYDRYSAALDTLGVAKQTKPAFWKLSFDDEEAWASCAEDTAKKWPEYKDNQARMGLSYRSAQEFLALTAENRAAALKESQGTGRSWYHVIRGYYNAEDGWKVYQDCRSQMGRPVAYSEHDFINLPIPDINALVREAKKVYVFYQRYSVAMAQLQLEALSKEKFCALGDNQVAQVESVEDAAKKWPEYSENMKRLGQPFKERREFLTLSADKRANFYQVSRGTSRSAWQFVSGNYSAEDGWATYRDSLNALGLPLKYSEYEFIHLSTADIDGLARHAKKSHELFSNLKELCGFAGKPSICTASDIYASDDLSKLDQEYAERQREWAPRILYANSCKQVGAVPNWSVFDSKTPKEQIEAAVLADTTAKNRIEYKNLCKKLERQADPDFLNRSVADQQAMVRQLSDELWTQRKQTIKKVGTVAAIIIAAIIVKRAYDDLHSSSDAAAESEPSNGVAGSESEVYKSRIDRNEFRKQRQEFWKTDLQQHPERYSPDAADRINSNKAPIGEDGFPEELHHRGGGPNDALIPMTRTDHRLGDNYSKNHPWLFEKKE